MGRIGPPLQLRPVSDYDLITTEDQFADLIDTLLGEAEYALDTEFHRERTYFPKVALVQIAWSGGTVIVDPLEVSLEPFASVLESDAVAVMHAADQDLEVLLHATGTIPRRLFDTQIAAGFVGMSTPSLASLHDVELGLRLPKGDRLTDWLRRPLSTGQLDYAASDVLHLLEIARRLSERISAKGRLGWAEIEFEELRSRTRGPRDPDEAWRRIKEAKHLRGPSVGIIAALAAWREQRAIEMDLPPRFLISDLGLVGIAQRDPDSVDEFKHIRGLDSQQLQGDRGEELLEVVRNGRTIEPGPLRNRRAPNQRDTRPAVALISAWVNQLAKDLELDPALLASRADIEALVRGDADAELANGWRADAVGDDIARLLDGRAALAFDRGRGLVLDDRAP